jgi:hypothetical protein
MFKLKEKIVLLKTRFKRKLFRKINLKNYIIISLKKNSKLNFLILKEIGGTKYTKDLVC